MTTAMFWLSARGAEVASSNPKAVGWEALDGRDVTGAASGNTACTFLMVSTILYASFAQTDGNLHSQTPGHDSQRSWSAYSQRGLHGKLLSSPTIGMNREVNASASTPGVEELGSLGAANASTLGTPAGFAIDVAVLNIGMPTAEHFSAQSGRRLEASGGDTTHQK